MPNEFPTSDLPRKKEKRKKKKRRRRRRRRIDNYGRETTNMLLAFAYASDSSLFVGKLWKNDFCLFENCMVLKIGPVGSTGSTMNRYVYRFSYHKKPKIWKNRKNLENCGSTRKPRKKNGQIVYQRFSNLASKQLKKNKITKPALPTTSRKMSRLELGSSTHLVQLLDPKKLRFTKS